VSCLDSERALGVYMGGRWWMLQEREMERDREMTGHGIIT
jgi:hypothetical protein